MTNNETLTEKTVVVNEFLLTLAESKLMEEMSQPHSHSEDRIHNWLCNKMPYNPELVSGILKAGRSIGGAYQYAYDLAKKQYMEQEVKGNVSGIMIEDADVFEWVTEYFKLDHLEENISTVNKTPINIEEKISKKPATTSHKKTKEVVEEQLDLFGGEF